MNSLTTSVDENCYLLRLKNNDEDCVLATCHRAMYALCLRHFVLLIIINYYYENNYFVLPDDMDYGIVSVLSIYLYHEQYEQNFEKM